MPDTNYMSMNNFIPEHLDDMVFFYANRIVKGPGSRWTIHVDPNECMVSMQDKGKAIPTIEELRKGELQREIGEDRIIFEGKVLFSGGVILTINGKILMLFRDEGAPVEPLKWTSPAGRCDREPFFTSLKEFYEEVIIFDQVSQTPIFVAFSHGAYTNELKEIYSKTLKRKGLDDVAQKWGIVHEDFDERYDAHLREVRTYFGPDGKPRGAGGEEMYEGRFFTYFEEKGNTLELRLLASVSIPPRMEGRLAFRDGEYERSVRLFSKKEFMLLNEASLVHTMAYFRDVVIKGQNP